MTKPKPILCLDFDGVIHKYTTPWTNAETISDDVTDGFFEWADNASQYFTLIIYSSRSKSESAIESMQFWMYAQRKKWRANGGQSVATWPVEFQFANEKPAAFLTIDDRAITFDGDWSKLNPEALLAFKPWNKREL